MPALLYLHGGAGGILKSEQALPFKKIGRASCRERV